MRFIVASNRALQWGMSVIDLFSSSYIFDMPTKNIVVRIFFSQVLQTINFQKLNMDDIKNLDVIQVSLICCSLLFIQH